MPKQTCLSWRSTSLLHAVVWDELEMRKYLVSYFEKGRFECEPPKITDFCGGITFNMSDWGLTNWEELSMQTIVTALRLHPEYGT